MKPHIQDKLNEVAWGLDLSSIMSPSMEEPTLGEIAWQQAPLPSVDMPVIGVSTLYEEISPKLSVLSSDEMLELIGMVLNDRTSSIGAEPIIEQEMLWEALPPVV